MTLNETVLHTLNPIKNPYLEGTYFHQKKGRVIKSQRNLTQLFIYESSNLDALWAESF